MKQNSFKSFTDLYPLSKTLRFELRPIGKTDEHIKKNGLIDEDTIRAENFKKAKKIIDRYHKTFIDEVLSEYKIPTEDLEKYAEFYKDTSADSEKFKALKDSMRKGISKAFTQHIKYKKLDDWESIVKDLTNSGLKEDLAIIDKFKNFTTYFKGFQKNRKNMYTDKAQTTGIANRLIEENLPIFINNLRVFEKIKEKLKKELSKIPSELSLPQGVSNLDNLFCLNGYNALLTQKGITEYNTIIGGKTVSKGTKIKGINEYINLYNQTQKNEKSRLPEIRNLKKQILSPIKTPSFIPEAFKEDQEVFKAILEIYEQFKENILPKEGASLRKLLTTLDEYDLDGVFVPQDKIGYLSSRLFGNRETLSEALKAHFEQEQAQKKTAKGRRKKKISGEEYYDKLTHVSVAHLDKVAQNIINEKIQDLGIKNENGLQALLKHELTKEGNLFDKVINAFEKGITVSIQNNTKSFPAIIELSKCYEQTNNKKETTKLIEDTEAATALKTAMDCLKSVQYFCYNLRLKKDIAEQDHLFYSKFSKYDTLFQDLNLVHDKVRNYLTQKPYSLDKIKLNFNNSTLLSGWDVSKEETYHGVILRKDGNYYLGIINPKHKRIFNQKFILKQNEKVWEKMNYAQIDDKSITSLMVINGETKCIKKDLDKWKQEYLPENINEIRISESYKPYKSKKKNQNFNKEDLLQYIEFYKQRVTEYKGDRFNFSFRKSSEYETWEDFKNDVKSQGYKMTFSNIPDSYINSLVDEGKLYLFWIYNKDFSPKKAKEGTPNLHTLYWKMLFDENNLKDIVYKLNGDAKIFHRKASLSIDKTTIHKSGTPIALRNPTQEKKENKFNYDIIKDRRFTEDKYFFHVPITINFKATGKDNLNNKVDQFIEQKFDNMHIIGIDRGERHLLYVSIIDTKGNIKEQFSLNTLENNGQNHDFHQKLAKREEDRIQARKNWQAMQGIKDLKTGYLSLVVHEIAKLILERNAIVVMEDLNIGFKNSRLKIEKSVYQKFENMLISKLNFLASKDQTQSNAPGGLLHGYQLTPPMGKVSDIGKRCGFIFYVPAWNTSQIDPVTGFVDLFDTKYSNVENAREFFQKFKDITYDKTDKLFAFEVKNYADFSKKAEDTRQSWVLYSHGERIEQKKNDKGYWVCEPVNLTEAMTRLFEDFNINIEKNLKDQIVKKTEAKFFKQLLWLFRLMVQMRNSEYQSSVEENHTPLDYIISPVKDAKGKFYCSEDYSGNKAELPIDADANGAYNIARKGLMLMQRIKDFKPVKDNDYVSLAISNKEWLNFVQEQDK